VNVPVGYGFMHLHLPYEFCHVGSLFFVPSTYRHQIVVLISFWLSCHPCNPLVPEMRSVDLASSQAALGLSPDLDIRALSRQLILRSVI
jgi:hypothetical protein